MGPLVFYSDAYLTELNLNVLIEGYLTSFLADLDLNKINRS